MAERVRNAGLTEPATTRQREKGYDVFTDQEVGNGASHIEKMDCMDRFESDNEAAVYAEMIDGVKIIHDINFEPGTKHYAHYIDTPENRKLLYQLIKDNIRSKLSILYGNQLELPIILDQIVREYRQLGMTVEEKKIFELSADDLLNLVDYHTGERPKKKVEYHYEKQQGVTCKVGDILHNTNGNDYRIMEKYTDSNLLLMDVKSGSLIVGSGVEFFRKLPKATEAELEKAKELIREYCENEFQADVDFKDYPIVSLGYTEDYIGDTEDNYAIIQSKADLENYKIITEVNGDVVEVESYDSMEDFIDYALDNLDYSDLISLSEEGRAVALGEKQLTIDVDDVSMEWGHGRYLYKLPSEIDFAALRREYSRSPEPNSKGEYDIEIREVLSRTESVKAGFYGEAVDRIMEKYKNGEIVLNESDSKTVDYLPAKEHKENR